MTRVADKYGAINLAQGFPDFPAPEEVKSAAVNAIQGDVNQYSITWGSLELREAVCEKVASFNGISANPDSNVTVTCGSTEAMMATVVALAGPGDEVIILEPAYENYRPAVILSGATARPIVLGRDFELDGERLKQAFCGRTRLVIVNTPHNPTGRVLSRQELKLVSDLCEDYNTVAITDEIYEHIIYDRKRHVSLATLGNMAERTVTISGISKTFTATGWRVGYAIAESGLTQAIRKVHDYLTVCAPAPLQEAAAHALRSPRSYYTNLARSYEKKRDYIVRVLVRLGFEFLEPQGAYYVLADFHQISKKNDVDFAQSLAQVGKVAVVPGSSFYSNGRVGRRQVRFSYSRKDSTLREAASRLERILG
jgi:aminotransferase